LPKDNKYLNYGNMNASIKKKITIVPYKQSDKNFLKIKINDRFRYYGNWWKKVFKYKFYDASNNLFIYSYGIDTVTIYIYNDLCIVISR